MSGSNVPGATTKGQRIGRNERIPEMAKAGASRRPFCFADCDQGQNGNKTSST
jgi:hypothetical protein